MTQSQAGKSTCKHCGKIGNEATNCLELVGYLTGWVAQGGSHGRESE